MKKIVKGIDGEDIEIELENSDATADFNIANQDFVGLVERSEKFDEIQTVIKDSLVDGVDYGIIPNTKMPTLFLGGAQKIQQMFGLDVRYEIVNKWEQIAGVTTDSDKSFFGYVVECSVYKAGVFIDKAQGVATTDESKFARQGALAAANSVNKIAHKRAFVSAIRNACGLANMFTVDLDDNEQINNQKVDKTGNANGKVNRHQIKDICARFGVWGLNPEEQQEVLSKVGVEDVKDLPVDKINEVKAIGLQLYQSKKKEKTGND